MPKNHEAYFSYKKIKYDSIRHKGKLWVELVKKVFVSNVNAFESNSGWFKMERRLIIFDF